MTDRSRCPKCGGHRLKFIDEALALFDCRNCGQRMDKRDYIEWALKNFSHKFNIDLLLEIVYEGVNRES